MDLHSASIPVANKLDFNEPFFSCLFFHFFYRGSATNAKFSQALLDIIDEAGVRGGCDKTIGALLYFVAGKFPANALAHRKLLIDLITSGKVKSTAQIDGSYQYLTKIGSEPVDVKALEEAAGVGVVVTPEQISAAVADVIAQNEAQLQERRYHLNLNILLGQVRGVLKWAEVPAVKAELDSQVAALLGPKTEADLAPPEKKKKAKAEKPVASAEKQQGANGATTADAADANAPPADPYAFLPKPDANNAVHTTVNFSDGHQMRISNSAAALSKHLSETGGKVVTRFPPEPNGYLHIGHAKAMFVDFGMAAQYDGVCYLRFDDTNPEAEKQEYIDHIQEIVSWLGWAPWKITYSSDYFDQLYELAVKLIKSGHAFVCHQTGDEIKASREKREGSPWRDRPIEESLVLFDDMRRGLVDEGTATLRMKMDPKNENFNMFDLIAYRIKFIEHPHAGDKWCIYPSYDYTHCLVDALENITHSMCTMEFETRRASYYWLLEVLDLYKPLVWEYSRLNITHNVLSKRKLNKLVMGNFVNGWDDPRLLTLSGLRRRGVSANAINAFCRDIGITRSEGEVHPHRLEHFIRTDLDANSPRALGVLRPLRVVITNLPDSHFEEVEAKFFPGRSDDGYKVPFTKLVYIENTDFRETDEKNYYGLAPGKSVMLRYAYPITCTGFTKGPDGSVLEVQVEYEKDFAGKKPPKGVLNWVGQPAPGKEPHRMEARLYDNLFSSATLPEEWLEDLNKDSLTIVSGAYATPHLAAAKPGEKFQLERLGYFCVDPDGNGEKLVLNRTVTLKESFVKQGTGKGADK